MIRVSCAALCRIEHAGRYLLLLNRNRRQKGVYVLSPIGGALALLDPGVLARFEARLEDPASLELRLQMPEAALADFRAWFEHGEGREQSPFRELQEELVHEARLLPSLTPEDVACTPLRTHEERALTNRQGQTGLLTHYFLELYDVRFTTEALLGPLLVPPPESGAVWVTREQIMARQPLRLRFDAQERDVAVRGELLLAPA